MIVLTSVNLQSKYVCKGDTFRLTVDDAMGSQVMIEETITEDKEINFIASYRFALEDGRCPGFHLCGIFGNQDELPEEIRNAKMLDDLTPEQLGNFIRTVGTVLI